MIKKSIIFSLGLLLVGLCSSCGSGAGGSSTPNNGNSTSIGKALRLAFVTNNASDYWTIARKGVEKADAELSNVTVDFKMPGSGAADEQKRIVDDLVSVGVNGIAMSPVDPDNQTQLINETVAYAESSVCRRKVLLHYFGEHWETDNCGNCDNCLSPPEEWDATDAARKFMSCIYRCEQASGFGFGGGMSQMTTESSAGSFRDVGCGIYDGGHSHGGRFNAQDGGGERNELGVGRSEQI